MIPFNLDNNSIPHYQRNIAIPKEEELGWTEHEIDRVDHRLNLLREKLGTYCTPKVRQTTWEHIDIQLDKRLNFMTQRDIFLQEFNLN